MIGTTGAQESFYIRAYSPTLNRNEGRHDLPHCYDTLIRNNIKKPDPPPTHNPSEPRLQTKRRAPGRPRTRPVVTDDPSQTAAKEVSSPIVAASTHTMATRSRTAHSNEGRVSPDWVNSQSVSLSSFCVHCISPFHHFTLLLLHFVVIYLPLPMYPYLCH